MKNYMLLFLLMSAIFSIYAASPKMYYICIVDESGQEYDFSKFPYDNVTFEYWITGREYETLNQDDCIANPAYLTVDSIGFSAIGVDLQFFPTNWEVGDELNVRIRQDDNPFDTLWLEVPDNFTDIIDSSPSIMIGFEKYGGGGGMPLGLYHISGGSGVSTITYPCVTTTGTDMNVVGLPFDNGWTKASDFDPSGTNMNAVSHWSSEHQGWYTAGHHPSLGWGTDFNVQTGQAYMINALNNFDFTVTGQYVKEDYDLFPTAGSDNNMILHPVYKYQLDSLSEIGNDIGTDYCGGVFKWNNLNQSWSGSSYNVIFGWVNDQPCGAGDGLMITMKDSINWPDKNAVKGSGIPRVAYFNLINASTGKALTYDEYRLIEFDAWIDQRPSEILHEYSYGCGFTMIDTFSVAYVEISNFTSGWNPGEYLNIRLTNFDSMYGCEFLNNYLDGSGSPLYIGFEHLIPGSGLPGQVDMNHINPITSVALDIGYDAGVATLYWGYNGYSIINIYSSDEPYGEFNLVTSVVNSLSWQIPTIEERRFYVATSSSGKSVPPKTIIVK